VRQLYGVVEAEKANAGIVATTSFFSSAAKKEQEKTMKFRMSLADYFDVRRWLQNASKRH
jgi:restriction system protein